MLESFPFSAFIGALLGVLAGLGTGGGSLLILWLTMVIQVEPQIARNINLLFYIPSAIIACFFRWKQGNLQIKKILPAIIAGSISAFIFSYIGRFVDIRILKKLFGMLLLFIGTKELFYRPRKAR